MIGMRYDRNLEFRLFDLAEIAPKKRNLPRNIRLYGYFCFGGIIEVEKFTVEIIL